MTRSAQIAPNLEKDMKILTSPRRKTATAFFAALMSLVFLFTFALSTATSQRTHTRNAASIKSVYAKLKKAEKNPASFTILSLSPYSVQNSSVALTLSTSMTDSIFTVAVLAPTNTRSELFDFADNLGKRSVKSSLDIPLSEFTVAKDSPDKYSIEIPVNSDPTKSLIFGAPGVYPLAISARTSDNKVSTEYTFITNIPTVGTSGYAYSQRLRVVPLLEFSPFVNRMALGTDNNALTDKGVKTRTQFSRVRDTVDSLSTINTPSSILLSPEALGTYAELSKLSPLSSSSAPLFPVQSSAEYLTDTYTPINLAELQKQGVSSAYTDLLTLGRSQITKAGYNSTARTLVTQTITPQSIKMIARSGIDNVIVDDSTFSRIQRTNDQPLTLSSDDSFVRVGLANTSITQHLSSDLSASAQANYLLAATTVVALEAPSIARGLILPLDLARLDAVTLNQFLQATINNPLVEPLTSSSYFSQLTPDKSASKKLSKAEYPTNVAKTFDKSAFQSVEKSSGATQSMFATSTSQNSHAFWMSNGVYSRTDRHAGAAINPVTAAALTHSVEKYIALPEKRTLTITSRENKIPVTIKNTSGSPITVIVRIDSDKLAFPKGTEFPVILREQNTTVKIPVKARTSGSFPITIEIASPSGNVVVAEQSATVRSTVVSGAGVAIAIASALFLAIWWGSHVRKTRKKPLAPVIELPHENVG